MINLKDIARDFVVTHLGAREDFFNATWDFISQNYEKLSLSTLSGDKLQQISRPLSISGEEKPDHVIAVLIFVDGMKQIPIEGKVKDLIAAIQSASKRHQEHGRMMKEILNKLSKFNPEESVKDSKSEKKAFESEIMKDTDGLWYKNLGLKIDCGDKSRLTFFTVGKQGKEVLVKVKEKSFALLTRLAVAMKSGESKKTGGAKGYVNIHTTTRKVENCNGCDFNGKCLYFEYRRKNKFRDLLSQKNIFSLSKAEKRNLILLRKGMVRLAILPQNITIKNCIPHLKNLNDQIDPNTKIDPGHQKGVRLAKRLLEDAFDVYESYLKSQSKLPDQKS